MAVVNRSKSQTEYWTKKPMAWQRRWCSSKSRPTPVIINAIVVARNKADSSRYSTNRSLNVLYILKKSRKAIAIEQVSIPKNPPLLKMSTTFRRTLSGRLELQSLELFIFPKQVAVGYGWSTLTELLLHTCKNVFMLDHAHLQKIHDIYVRPVNLLSQNSSLVIAQTEYLWTE